MLCAGVEMFTLGISVLRNSRPSGLRKQDTEGLTADQAITRSTMCERIAICDFAFYLPIILMVRPGLFVIGRAPGIGGCL